jgi:uncharacterized membrane protein YgcG
MTQVELSERRESLPDLSPAEATVLLDLSRATGPEALKRTMLELVWLKCAAIEKAPRSGVLGKLGGHTVTVSPGAHPERAATLAAHEQEVFRIVERVCANGPKSLEDLNKEFRNSFGNDVSGYRNRIVLPSLTERGLVAEKRRGLMGWLGGPRYQTTEQGDQAIAALNARLNEARGVPALIAQDPARSAALLAGLGMLIFLVPELLPQYRSLIAMGEGDTDLDFDFDDPDIPDMDTMSAMDDMGSSFDTGFSGSDAGGSDSGGGDSGGGDSGGGGGD